jgi:hypothetical protein
MVEFLVAAIFFLVPLFLSIIVLGKLIDVRHTTNMASRYATWERTVWYDDAGSKFNGLNGSNQKTSLEIASEVGVRVVNDHSSSVSVLKNSDRNARGFTNGIDPLWHDNQHQPYLNAYAQQTVSVSNSKPNLDIADSAISIVASLPLPTEVVGTMVPPVPADTLALAQVSFKELAKNSEAYKRLWPSPAVLDQPWNGIDFAASGGILSNTWYANGSSGTHSMVKGMVPTASGLGSTIGTAINVITTVWDPIAPKIEFGKIAPDVMPPDRLR